MKPNYETCRANTGQIFTLFFSGTSVWSFHSCSKLLTASMLHFSLSEIATVVSPLHIVNKIRLRSTSNYHHRSCFFLYTPTGKTFTLEGTGSNNEAIIPMCISGLFQVPMPEAFYCCHFAYVLMFLPQLLSDKQVRSNSRRRSANARVTTTITMQYVILSLISQFPYIAIANTSVTALPFHT